MSTDFTVTAEIRGDMGKGASRRLRREGRVPAVVYGTEKDAQPITIDRNKILHALDNEAFYSTILTLNVAGDAQQVVLKDVQRHPCKPDVFHLDFLRIDASEKLRMQVPLHFIGVDLCPGVKQGGGVVSHLVNQVEISCLPMNLPEFLDVDLSQTELDQTLHLSDIKVPEGVELVELTSELGNDLPIASVHVPKIIAEPTPEEEAAAAEEGAEAAEGEGAEGGADDAKAEGGKAEGGK